MTCLPQFLFSGRCGLVISDCSYIDHCTLLLWDYAVQLANLANLGKNSLHYKKDWISYYL